MSIGPYISIIGLLLLSAFFSGSEIAYASVNETKLRQMSKTGGKKATIALYIYENFEAALTTILIGNNLVNIASSSISTLIVISLVGDKGVFFSTLLLTVFILIFGEITPKLVAKNYSMRFTLNVAYPIYILMKITKPISFLVGKFLKVLSKLFRNSKGEECSITEEEIICMIDANEEEGLFDKERGALLKSSLEYDDIFVKEIYTPRKDLEAINIASDFNEIKKTILESRYSRIPVYEKRIDNIIGVIRTSAFLLKSIEEESFDIREILLDPVYIVETMKIPDVFKKLNLQRSQLGIVVNEYGGVQGCVTIEDVLEELVGEIWDETDTVKKEFNVIDKDTYMINGDASLRDLEEYLPLPEFETESGCRTLGGFIVEMLGRVPMPGESLNYKNINMTVSQVDKTHISKLILEMK
jgi:CBS domain containing-hemolysin-like protein